jgi:hypothetical protein
MKSTLLFASLLTLVAGGVAGGAWRLSRIPKPSSPQHMWRA